MDERRTTVRVRYKMGADRYRFLLAECVKSAQQGSLESERAVRRNWGESRRITNRWKGCRIEMEVEVLERIRNVAISVTIAAVIVFVASFLPWGELRGELSPSGLNPFGFNPFEGITVEVSVDAWDSHMSLAGLKLPNGLVVIVAIASAALVWLGATGAWSAPTGALVALGVYGVFHSLWVLGLLLFSNEGTPGIGLILTALAMLYLLISTLRMRGAPRAATE